MCPWYNSEVKGQVLHLAPHCTKKEAEYLVLVVLGDLEAAHITLSNIALAHFSDETGGPCSDWASKGAL